jgi:RNA polymerase sigma-70 factor (ECF subfamily)
MSPDGRCKDKELAEGVARNDRACLAAFFGVYHAGVFRFMLCLTGNRHDAEDLAQDSLLQAKTKIKSFRGDAALKTWVHQVAYHTFTHWNRGRPRHEALPPQLAGHDRSFTAVDDGQTLLAALIKLGPAFAYPFVLQEVCGHSVEEIARILDLPKGTVKSRLHTARQRMRALLGPEENYHA